MPLFRVRSGHLFHDKKQYFVGDEVELTEEIGNPFVPVVLERLDFPNVREPKVEQISVEQPPEPPKKVTGKRR